MTMSIHRLTFISLLAACTGGDTSTTESAATVDGTAAFRDATTNTDGSAHDAATPPSQGAHVSVIVKGTGEVPHLDPQCAQDPLGSFEAHYTGTATVSDDGAYAAAFGSAAAEILSPSGCAIPDLTVGLITDVVVRAELAVNTQNCSAYCAASARADAEAECGATPSSAQCRTSAQAQAEASCQTSCTTEAHLIVGEVSIGASAIGHADIEMLRAAAFGQLEANLELDHLEDAQGRVIAQ
ncbi:MAG: hypothetical protein HOV81_08730 [Kofleriaceae bacterium]|nr:hypothetical protein [Kofleriaceae bacterium]